MALNKLVNFMKSYSKENQFILATHSLVLVNSVKPDEIVICTVEKDGQSTLNNVSNMTQLKKRFRESYVDFSNYIFFEDIENPEFQTLK